MNDKYNMCVTLRFYSINVLPNKEMIALIKTT